jgi:hypothetical protein
VLGRVWLRRAPLPNPPGGDLMFLVGKPILDACVAIGGTKGKTVLRAIAQMDRGQLGVVAGVLADSIEKARSPRWMPEVGNAPITRAFSADATGDGEGVLLETDDGRNDAHMIAAFVSERLGGIVRWFRLLRVVDPLDPAVTGGQELHFTEVDPTLACRRLRAAIERTDAERAPAVDAEHSMHRALAIARCTPAPTPPARPVASRRAMRLLCRVWAWLRTDPWAGRRRHRRQHGGSMRSGARSGVASCSLRSTSPTAGSPSTRMTCASSIERFSPWRGRGPPRRRPGGSPSTGSTASTMRMSRRCARGSRRTPRSGATSRRAPVRRPGRPSSTTRSIRGPAATTR